MKRKILIKILLIYIVYISLGIPDSIVGVTLPAIRGEFSIPIAYGSILTVIVLILAACSSISYAYIEKHMKVGTIMCLSSLLTMLGLYFVSQATSFFILCLAVIPMGLGAGAIDATINNFVSKNLNFKHMIWLHGFFWIDLSIKSNDPDISFMCEFDIVTVFSNVLDNAIEALADNSEDKKINLFISKVNNFIVIRESNKIVDDYKIISGNIISTKKGHTGLGLMSIRNTIKKYDGFVTTEIDNQQQFIINIMIPIQ